MIRHKVNFFCQSFNNLRGEKSCKRSEKKTNMFKELKQMMSEGLEGAKEQVLNKSIINLDDFYIIVEIITLLNMCRLITSGTL